MNERAYKKDVFNYLYSRGSKYKSAKRGAYSALRTSKDLAKFKNPTMNVVATMFGSWVGEISAAKALGIVIPEAKP